MSIWPGQNRLRRPPRPAFTLAELLVVIAIIGVLASMTLFAFYGVREDARERRARAQVTKIHELIMRKWESYRTRPVPVDRPRDPRPQLAAQKRLYALRELMRMELPDRKADVMRGFTYLALEEPPSLCRAYQRRAVSSWDEEYESAECLYLILATMRDGDTTGLDFFPEDEIGDVDADGMPEILDPWGVPIRFLRWAPGFQSDIQTGPREALADDDSFNPDPFDPLKVDERWEDDDPSNDPFALYPLIVSGGRDKQFNESGWNRTLSADDGRYDDPYSDARAHLGSQGPESSDNITNHFLEVR
ncbi:MAG: type II secretion system protein [Planctomycetota bacterium]